MFYVRCLEVGRYPYCAISSDPAVSEEFKSEEFVSEELVESFKSLSEAFVEVFIELDSFLYGNVAKERSRKAKSKIKDSERYILELCFCVLLLLPALGKRSDDDDE